MKKIFFSLFLVFTLFSFGQSRNETLNKNYKENTKKNFSKQDLNERLEISNSNSLINDVNKKKYSIDKLFFGCSSIINDVSTKKNFKTRNILSFEIVENNQILMNYEPVNNGDIKEGVIKFLQNNGDNSCNYCEGELNPESSSNPNKAYISIKKTSNDSWYQVQINLYDKIREAYNSLWTRQYNKDNNASLEVSEFLNLDCKIKNIVREKYFPVNVIYLDRDIITSPPASPVLELIEDEMEIEDDEEMEDKIKQ